MSNTFPKYERLCGQIRIASLYKEGRKFVVWPLRVTYIPHPEGSQVLIWASKSLFKHAVDRNRLRRQMREAWRLNKARLQQPCILALNYMDNQMQPYELIEKAVQKAIKKLNEEAHS